MRREMQLDFSGIKTNTAFGRHNLVRIDTLKTPGADPAPAWEAEGFDEFVERAYQAKKRGAQLIFSSQDVSTMRNDVFRRDEIWFAARGEGEASQLWSLADIHEANGNLVSKNAAFDKQYLSGRYGADPYLTRIEEWD